MPPHGQVSIPETTLHKNPFYVLAATTRDNQTRLVELAAERALIVDPDLCQKACSNLVNPRLRLASEVGWLPGSSPRQARQVIETLHETPSVSATQDLPPLAQANVLAARMENAFVDRGVAVNLLAQLAQAVGQIDVVAVIRDINGDRSVAGIPPVKDLALVDAELASRRLHYRAVARDLLDRLPTEHLIEAVSELAANDTVNGAEPASDLIDAIVDSYETGAQAFLEGESKNIEELIARTRSQVRDGDQAQVWVEHLCGVVANWSRVTRPIQLVHRAKGVDHPASRSIASDVRSLSVDLTNNHRMVDLSLRLTACLRWEFQALLEFSERVQEDSVALIGIKQAQEEVRRNREESE
jgi:hypothetical protein